MMLTDVDKLKRVSKHVIIRDMVRMAHAEVIEIGEGTQIDDFVLINGGRGIVIGRYNHICSFVTIIGGGELVTGDYVGIAAGCRIITGQHHYKNGMRMVSTAPSEQQDVNRGCIVIEKDAFIGSNAIILPDVTIGEGALISAGCVVNKDVEPWTINAGSPARVIGNRPRVSFD